MIEKMKKLSLIIYHNSKDKFLKNLQALGVVDLDCNTGMQNEEITDLNNKIIALKKAGTLLNKKLKETKIKIKQTKYNKSILELLDEINIELDKLDNLNEKLDEITREISLLTPWGNFNPDDLNKLADIGLKFKFYSLSRSKFNKLKKDDIRFEIISEIKNTVYFVVVYEEGEVEKNIGIAEDKVPIKELNKLLTEKDKLLQNIEKQDTAIAGYSKYLDVIHNEILKTEDKLSYIITDRSLSEEAEGKVLVITGWIPLKNLNQVKEFLDKEDIVYLLDNPKPDENVPVLLKNGPFAKLFEPITKMHSLPQYNEIDPTPFFAPFFAIFFGLCLGDFGYGLFILSAIIIALLFLGKKKNTRKTIFLAIILCISTVFCGLLMNSFFGEKIVNINFFPQRLKNAVIFTETSDAMLLAIFVGVIQVTVGLLVQMINRTRMYGIQGAFKPIGTILLLFPGIIGLILWKGGSVAFLGFVLKDNILKIPNILMISSISAIIGFIFVLFFNNIEKKFYIRPALGLWELYGIITGIPGDILSYIRLFALGLASGLLGNAFNSIAFMVKDGVSSSGNIIVILLGYLGMTIILLLGHTINLGLAALSAFVHPLRLILLEFYKSVDFTGGGRIYSPFKNRS